MIYRLDVREVLRGITCTHRQAIIKPCGECIKRFGPRTKRCQQLSCTCGLRFDLLEGDKG